MALDSSSTALSTLGDGRSVLDHRLGRFSRFHGIHPLVRARFDQAHFSSSNDPTTGNFPTSGLQYSTNAGVMSLPPLMYSGDRCFVSFATFLMDVVSIS